MKKVHTKCWNGFIFVCLAEKPMDFDEFLGPLHEILSPYNFSQMTLVEDQTAFLECNWKAVIDNFSELYHVDFLHPQHKRMVDCCNDTVRLFEHGHTGVEVPGGTVSPRFPIPEMPTDIQTAQLQSVGLDPEEFKGRVLDVREALQQQKRKVGARKGMDYSGLTDNQLSDVWQYNIFPNIVLSFTPEHCWILRPRPHPTDPSKCEFDKLSLVKFADETLAEDKSAVLSPGRRHGNQDAFKAEDYVRPPRDIFSYQAVIDGKKTMTDTIDQDVELLGAVQKGMGSDGFDTVFLNEDEMRIQHFHNYLNEAIG
jgi:phenylpropionate dioxygenase-like ring-hydroxylating dioxygenase large terminal subunit